MPNPLAGFLLGLVGAGSAAEAGVSTYEKRKDRELRQQSGKREQERIDLESKKLADADSPLPTDQLSELNDTLEGNRKVPEKLPAKLQIGLYEHLLTDQTQEKRIKQQEAAADKRQHSASVELRDAQFWEKQWIDLGKDMDLQKSGTSRSPLGVAVLNNMKAGRAMQLLDAKLKDPKYKFTPQDMSLITTDLTAIMKGGSPDEELLRQQQYGTYYKEGIELLQRLSNRPQDIGSKEIKQHLRQVINGVRDIDNKAIENHIATVEKTRKNVIKRRPEEWEELKQQQLDFIGYSKNPTSIDPSKDKHDTLLDSYGVP